MDYNNSSRWFRPLSSRVMALSIKYDSLALRTVTQFVRMKYWRIDSITIKLSGAPNENIAQNHLNMALLNVF